MARKPMVTRTIKSTVANIMCLEKDTAEVVNKSVVLPRTYKNEEDILKAARPLIEADGTVKAVYVVDTKIEEARYGMTEQDFIAHAHVLTKDEENEGEVTENE